ncbi:MAG: hypothetical protein ACE5J5_03700 [Candidatus Hydrothermarchaeales archaeon]
MDKIKGTLLDIDYITKDKKAIIRLFLKNRESPIAIDDSFSPYFLSARCALARYITCSAGPDRHLATETP